MNKTKRNNESPKPKKNNVCAIRLPSEKSLPQSIKSIFKKCKEKIGFVPNVLRAYTLRQNKFEYFRSYNNELMLGESGLSKLDREIIAVVVSSANHCNYCLVAHGAAVRHLSGDAKLGDDLASNYREAKLNKRQKLMSDFAWKLTTRPHEVHDADRSSLRMAGFNDKDIFDIVEVTGFYNMSNRIASGLSIKPNDEYYDIGR
tara:strand:+ start:16779 stop:17384 length:606 start_codon:yes stop_codon:yes gene_type:complete